MGGFEGADHVNAAGDALDMAAASGHADNIEADHALAASAGLQVVRESIGWRLAEPEPGRFDLSRLLRIERSARRHGLQVAWTLMHYGLPADLSLHDDGLIERFARFAAAVAVALTAEQGRRTGRPPLFTPINEIGFLAWCAAQPGMLSPPNNWPDDAADSASVSGYEVKRRLVRAALAAIAAMRAVRPDARFMHVEPVVHVVAPVDRPELEARAAVVAGWQWQAWDMLSGRSEPELGGRPDTMDLLGVNHYHSSQWELLSERRLRWHEQDPRRRPLHVLLAQAWQRYRVPLVLAETSHIGVGRAAWLHDIAGEVRRAGAEGVPVRGVCLYPLLDRPDWNEPSRWHRSGLWHVPRLDRNARVVDADYRAALQAWQAVLPASQPRPRPPTLLVLADSRWSERPGRCQQLVSRLAGRWHVFYVEPARPGAAEALLQGFAAAPDVDVLVPLSLAPLSAQQLAAQLVARLAGPSPAHGGAGAGLAAPDAVWIERPQDAVVAEALGVPALVCDVRSPADGSAAALPWLSAWQRACSRAALVLGSDHRLAAHLPCAPGGAVRVLGPGADLQAFVNPEPGGWNDEEAALLQPPAGAPRIGYVGCIDRSIDLMLLQALALARPDWHWLLCGPLRGVGADELPQRANLHWLDEAPRRLVPALMAGWHVAMLPMRSPSLRAPGALEALASGLPVVAASHGGHHSVGPWRAAGSAREFVLACEACLHEAPAQRAQRLQTAQLALAGRDWAELADSLHGWLVSLPLRPAAAASR